MESYWRKISAPIIAEVLKKGLPEKDEHRQLIKVYPFGERIRHPYKIWLDEIKRQKGLLPPLGTTVESTDENQLDLF
jgi:hypothetical protein